MMGKKITFAYIAGCLTPAGVWSRHPCIDYLGNMRQMIRAAVDVFQAGFSPFCPALDFMYFLHLNEGEHITEASIKRYSKDWLSKCDCIVLTPNWRKSPGTIAEIKYAKERNIPVFETLEELIAYDTKPEEETETCPTVD